MRDYSNELKQKIKKYQTRGFEYGKSQKYLSHRVKLSKEKIEQELKTCDCLSYTIRKETDGEIRYTLYFIYNQSKGRSYVITFRNKIRVITAFFLGRKTIKKYFRKKFINKDNIKKT